jgi:hypothetical protein
LSPRASIVQILEALCDQHRSEDLLPDDAHVFMHVHEHGGLDEPRCDGASPPTATEVPCLRPDSM